MAQTPYRANLAAVGFPFTVDSGGRTVIIRGQDQTNAFSSQSTKDLDKDAGIPQLLYGHNILPTGDGYISVDYNSKVVSVTCPFEIFVQIIPIVDPVNGVAYLGMTATGNVYAIRQHESGWSLIRGTCGEPEEPAPTDPLAEFVVALLHCDDDTTDATGNHIPTFTGNYIVLPASTDWDLGTSEFCLEGMFTWSSLTSNRDLFGRWKDSSGNPISRWLLRYDGSGLTWYSAGNGTNFGASFTPTVGVKYHIAVCRHDDSAYCYVNGVELFNGPCADFSDSTLYPIAIGAEGANGDSEFTGTISEVRITKGSARYYSDFTPPTDPFVL